MWITLCKVMVICHMEHQWHTLWTWFWIRGSEFCWNFSCLTTSFKTISTYKSYDQSITPEQQLNSQVCVVIVFFLLKIGNKTYGTNKMKESRQQQLGDNKEQKGKVRRTSHMRGTEKQTRKWLGELGVLHGQTKFKVQTVCWTI